MRQFWTVAVLSAVLTSLPQAVNAAAISFTSTLNGTRENPPVNTPATGTGTGTLSGDPGSYVFTYEVSYFGLRGSVAPPLAHIHLGPQGVNGPIIHDLDNASNFIGTTKGMITGDWRFDDPTNPLTDTFAQELLNGNLYFNIHSEFSRSGEIRDQIKQVPEPSPGLGVVVLGALGAVAQLRNQRCRQKSARSATSVANRL